ncbi:MAG: inositol monophosphatase family protein [Crocinitomicaceae bacterium]|nr:inositol monophosphatase family protein [Crocinitomicaceae bacterium]
MHQLPSIYRQAIQAAISASRVISEIYREPVTARMKEDGSPVTKADLASSKVIADHLLKTDIPITGEEREKRDFETRSQWTENWCVDPLDGTRMFLKRNGEFSVNIAHIVNHQPAFGIIASPVHKEVIVGGADYGCFLIQFEDVDSPEKWKSVNPHSTPNDPLRIICSHSYQASNGGTDFESYTENRAHEYIRRGSAIKFFNLALGSADIYPRFAPTMEWDIAAGHAILNALGGTIIDAYSNEPLTYNKESLYNPHFIAKTKAIQV